MNKNQLLLKFTFSIFFLLTIISCEKDESIESTSEATSAGSSERVESEATSTPLVDEVSFVNTSTMNETNFDNGSLSPFYVRNTSGGNTAQVISQRAKFHWKQANYNGRLTRDFQGAEIASYIEFTEEVYVGFKLYVPATGGSWGFPDNRNTTIAQILTAAGCSSWAGMLEIKNNDLYISHRGYCGTATVQEIVSDIDRNTWHDIQIRWVPSNDLHGGIQIKYNGTMVYSKYSQNFAWGTFSSRNVLSGSGNNYMQVKYGMYCHDSASYTGSSHTGDTRTIYIDNASVRQGSNGWSATDPNN